MLQYLDNNQNAVGHLNENYAREVMECTPSASTRLYPSRRATARTRAHRRRINVGGPPKLKAEWQPLYRRAGRSSSIPRGMTLAPSGCSGRHQGTALRRMEEP